MTWRTLLGATKIALALTLGALALLLPSGNEVVKVAASLDETRSSLADQIVVLRRGIADLRAGEVERFADETRRIATSGSRLAEHVSVNVVALEHVDAALRGACEGLAASCEVIEGHNLEFAHDSLVEVARYLDEKVVPAAKEASGAMRKLSLAMENHGRQLADVLDAAPLGADAVLGMVASLRDFGDALAKTEEFAREIEKRMPEIVNGLRDAKQAVRVAAKIAYGTPFVDSRPIYGTSDALGKSADAIEAFSTRLLPSVATSIESAKAVIARLSERAKALEGRRDDIDRVLKATPEALRRLSGEGAAAAGRMSDVFEETSRVSAVASSLRQAASRLDAAKAGVPGVVASLRGTHATLDAARKRIQGIVSDPGHYERVGAQVGEYLQATAAAMEFLNTQLQARLDEEDRILGAFGNRCQSMALVLPDLGGRVGWVFSLLRAVLAGGAALAFLSGGIDLRTR